MDEIINSKITELLNSPELMKNVKNILSGINNSTEKVMASHPETETSKDVKDIIQTISDNGTMNFISKFFSQNQNERIALLSALRPFLSTEKQETIDFIIQILKAINVFFTINSLS